jgi:hypothetical protein
MPLPGGFASENSALYYLFVTDWLPGLYAPELTPLGSTKEDDTPMFFALEGLSK